MAFSADGNPKNKEAPHNGEALEQQIKSPTQWPGSFVVSRCTAEHVAIKTELFHMDNCFYRYSEDLIWFAKLTPIDQSFSLEHKDVRTGR